MSLSSSQKEAIMHFKGPAMVLAGPGSGKTTVITYRTKYLIEHYQVEPVHILVVTFTRAAANEMKSRFLALRKENRTAVRFGTFHSVFFEILKLAYHLTADNILGEEKKYQILKEMIQKMDLDIEDEADFLKSIIQEIGLVKSERVQIHHYYSTTISDDVFREIYQNYQKKLEEMNLLDYDDILIYTWELLKERPDILSGWQKRYQYILIDEFQDINPIQYDIVKMLASPENNLFVVGDDDQSIYRFRGAKPELMLHFPDVYPEAKKILLDYNFRCPDTVVKMAAKVIDRNIVRYDKQIREVKTGGEPVEFRIFQNQHQESLGIIDIVRKFLAQGHSYDEIAVLYRSNMDARIISQRFMEYNIPIQMRDVVPNLYEHWIAKNMICYLKAASGCMDRSVILPIINRPKRYISRDCLDQKTVDLNRLRMYYEDKYWVIERIDKFESDLRMIRRMDPYTAMNYIRHAVGYEEYLEEYAQYRKMKPEELYEIMDQLQESAKGSKTTQEWFDKIDQYAQLLKEQKQSFKSGPAVTFSTLHSSKGLEFPMVFIIDINEGIIPHKKASLQSDIEEERRMFYVGMTRASEKLYLCSIKEKNGKSINPSPFLMGLK